MAQASARGTKDYKGTKYLLQRRLRGFALWRTQFLNPRFGACFPRIFGVGCHPSIRKAFPLRPPVRRHVARGAGNFLIPCPPSLRLLVLVVCVKGVHKSPLARFQGFYPIQPLQTLLKRAVSVLRAFTKLSLDSPTKNVQKRQGEALRGSQGHSGSAMRSHAHHTGGRDAPKIDPCQ